MWPPAETYRSRARRAPLSGRSLTFCARSPAAARRPAPRGRSRARKRPYTRGPRRRAAPGCRPASRPKTLLQQRSRRESARGGAAGAAWLNEERFHGERGQHNAERDERLGFGLRNHIRLPRALLELGRLQLRHDRRNGFAIPGERLTKARAQKLFFMRNDDRVNRRHRTQPARDKRDLDGGRIRSGESQRKT